MSWQHRYGGGFIQGGGETFGATFRYPGFLTPATDPATYTGHTLQFQGLWNQKQEVVLEVHRLAVGPNINAAEVCDEILRVFDPWIGILSRIVGTQRSHSSEAWVGPLEGVEMINRNGSVIARAAISPGDQAYGIVMALKQGRLDQSTYRMFDRTCRSLQPMSPQP